MCLKQPCLARESYHPQNLLKIRMHPVQQHKLLVDVAGSRCCILRGSLEHWLDSASHCELCCLEKRIVGSHYITAPQSPKINKCCTQASQSLLIVNAHRFHRELFAVWPFQEIRLLVPFQPLLMLAILMGFWRLVYGMGLPSGLRIPVAGVALVWIVLFGLLLST